MRLGLARRQPVRRGAGGAAAPGPWSVGECLDCIAIAALSYVAGFVGQTPGGLGVREVILQQFLVPQLGGEARALVVVLLLRVLWTAAELVAAGVLFWLPVKKSEERGNGEWNAGESGESRRESAPDRLGGVLPYPTPSFFIALMISAVIPGL